jgi:membrane protein
MSETDLINTTREFLKKIFFIIRKALASFSAAGGARGAAGMAYYTLFSLFPLLIVLVTVGTYFVDGSEASSKVAQLVSGAIPVSQHLVEVNLSRILIIRNSVGVVSLVVLLWSGSNAFSMMVHHITSAWPKNERRNFFARRLFGLAMVVVLIVLLFILMLSSTILNVFARYSSVVPGLDILLSSWLWNFGAKLMYWVVPFLFFYSIYRIIPMGRVPVKAAGFSAFVITIAWRLASNGFQWYLGSGFARYEVIFGSLSAIAVLLLWIYISSLIMFFGAHLCAAGAGKVELEGSNI